VTVRLRVVDSIGAGGAIRCPPRRVTVGATASSPVPSPAGSSPGAAGSSPPPAAGAVGSSPGPSAGSPAGSFGAVVGDGVGVGRDGPVVVPPPDEPPSDGGAAIFAGTAAEGVARSRPVSLHGWAGAPLTAPSPRRVATRYSTSPAATPESEKEVVPAPTSPIAAQDPPLRRSMRYPVTSACGALDQVMVACSTPGLTATSPGADGGAAMRMRWPAQVPSSTWTCSTYPPLQPGPGAPKGANEVALRATPPQVLSPRQSPPVQVSATTSVPPMCCWERSASRTRTTWSPPKMPVLPVTWTAISAVPPIAASGAGEVNTADPAARAVAAGRATAAVAAVRVTASRRSLTAHPARVGSRR
jgi:hypothetical protein